MFSLLNKKRPVKEQYVLVEGMVWRKKNMNLEENKLASLEATLVRNYDPLAR